MNTTNLSALQELFRNYLNVEAYFPEKLSHWCRNTNVPSGVSLRQQFRQELQYALTHQGTVTPELYERWTYEDLDDQAEVQKRLQEIWDACFS